MSFSLPSVIFFLGHLLFMREVFSLKDIPLRARGGVAWSLEDKLLVGSASSSAQIWQTKLDHFDASNNITFSQRYYVDAQYYDASNPGPVFFEIGGEGPLESAPGGYLASLAKNHSALLVALEHRYYGGSVPDSISNPMATENLKFLTVENALADLASFTDYFKSAVNSATASVSWFVFGGSYPGALASWYRIQYPDHSVGSLSSSGVVNCIVDFTGFDKQVAAAVGNSCSDRLRATEAAFERLANTSSGWKTALRLFHCEADMWRQDFFYMIADSWSMADQYSAKSSLCSALEAVDPQASDMVVAKAFADFSNSFWGDDFCAADNTEALRNPARWEPNARSWRWQTCYQVSYFNTAPSSGSLRSETVDLDYHLRQCAYIFRYPMFPSSAQMNAKFGGGAPTAHNVFYSDFSDDPWQRASVDYPVSADQPYNLVKCDDCGHCKDFKTPSESDPEELKAERREFEQYLNKWLYESH